MILTDKQKECFEQVNIAKEKFLLEMGWTKSGKHFSPPKRIAWVYPGDKIYIGDAFHAQESYLDDAF